MIEEQHFVYALRRALWRDEPKGWRTIRYRETGYIGMERHSRDFVKLAGLCHHDTSLVLFWINLCGHSIKSRRAVQYDLRAHPVSSVRDGSSYQVKCDAWRRRVHHSFLLSVEDQNCQRSL